MSDSLKKLDVLADENAVSLGCYVSDGKLVPGLNLPVRLNRIHLTPVAAWYAAGLKTNVVFGDNKIYHAEGEFTSPTQAGLTAQNPSFVETRVGLNTQAYVIGDTAYYDIGAKTTRPFKGGVHSCILKNGRIFGIDNSNPYKIKWSGEGGIDDWAEGISGAGWTTVQSDYGKILNLVVYKDKIVALREYGLTFFSAYGTPENYKLSYFDGKLPKIHENTAAVAGNKLVFYTEGGLYFYDGNGVEKSSARCANDVKTPISVSSGNGQYFLCGLSKTLNNYGLLIYDSVENAVYLSNVQANALLVGENIYFYSGQYEYRLEKGGRYSFTTDDIDLSTKSLKLLREVEADDTDGFLLEVFNGRVWRMVNCIRGKYRPKLRGKKFKIKVYGKDVIKWVSATVEVLNEV